MSSILRKAMWPAAIIAMMLGLMSISSAQATDTDEVNEATLEVDQGSCPDYQLAVTVVGDDDSPTDVRIDGLKQELDGGNPTLGPGESHVFDQAGEYELDIVDGGATAEVLVFNVEDTIEALPCEEEPTIWTLIVQKDTDPEDDDFEEHSFDFDVDPGPNFSLSDDEEASFEFAPGQNVSVTEDQDDGWDVESIKCKGDISSNDYDVNLDKGILDIDGGDLKAGDEVVCLYTNVLEPAPTPTPVPPVVDACDNIAGAQPTVPAGMVLRISGDLVLCEVPVATVVPPSISPPNTGDGGLLSSSNDDNVATRLAAGITAIFLGFGGIVLARRLG